MTIQVTGKNIDLGSSLQTYATNKINEVLHKYIGPELSGHVRVEKERSQFVTHCSVRLRTGLLIEAEGRGADAYASADAAIEHLDKRVRRYKRRLKSHHDARNGVEHAANPARDAVVQLDDPESEQETAAMAGPVIVAETERAVPVLSVSDAVMQLDLTSDPLLVFRNAASGNVNVVYRRLDGHVGWIDPGADAAAAGSSGGGKQS